MKLLLISLMMALLCRPSAAWAIQAHGGVEGVYVHQMAHLFFAFSMGLLIYWLRRRRLVSLKGWRYIQYAALWFIAWNGDAFLGHWLEEQSGLMDSQRIGLMHISLNMAQGFEWLAPVYYLVKLDHLLCVPAMLCLFLGLRRLLREPS
ncbi:MAG: hypothetical protein HY911_06920 [Desulfobacterales bacterium]|nr:hypothetical protein [Desulfobacterales bacterium]